MRFKLDENLPERLVGALAALDHDVDTVAGERLTGRNDYVVCETAQESGRFLITRDLDFSDVRRFTPGSHHGLLLVRSRFPGRTALFQRIQSLFATEEVSAWSRCLVVATDRKLRIRRAGPGPARTPPAML